MFILALMVFTFGIAWILCRFFERGSWLVALDRPTNRSLHFQPRSRNGGLAISLALTAALSIFALTFGLQDMAWAIPGGLVLIVVSLVDDRGHVDARIRLASQVAAVLSVLLLGPGQELSLELFVICTLVGVWAINLYNFMDGMDGFAGTMAVVGFGSLAYLGWTLGQLELAVCSLLVVASSSGFLARNWPPAHLFLGDVGSTLLGYLAFTFSFKLVVMEDLSLFLPLLIFSPFWVDATVTLLRRIFQGERFWLPHRSHYYQRLVLMGWGHKKTLLWEFALMLGCGLSALVGTFASVSGQIAIVLFWGLVYGAIIVLFPAFERKHTVFPPIS